MNILLTICARKGSKGVKNKNIRDLAGKPLISYTIEVAKKWGKADKIICSTDSDKIAEICRNSGIDVPFMRPANLATDKTGKIEVIHHALISSERIFNKKFDIVVDLDVTAPIRKTEDLDGCLKIFNEKNPDVAFSVVESRKNPYFNMVEEKKDGFVKIVKYPAKTILRRQDAPKVYDMNTSIYIFKRDYLIDDEMKSVTSTDRAAIYVMDPISAVDIDSEIDFKYIEFLVKDGVVEL